MGKGEFPAEEMELIFSFWMLYVKRVNELKSAGVGNKARVLPSIRE